MTVVTSDPAFRRSLRRSFADRVMLWMGEWLERFLRFANDLPSMRTIVLAIVALVAVFVVVRLIVALRDGADAPARVRGRRREGSSEDPWRDADSYAAAGQYEEAAHALYRGIIGALVREERIRLDPSKTSGDYARELRRRGSSAFSPFRAFVRRFDVAVYGHGGCNADAIAELRLLAEPFRPRARAA